MLFPVCVCLKEKKRGLGVTFVGYPQLAAIMLFNDGVYIYAMPQYDCLIISGIDQSLLSNYPELFILKQG